LRRVIESIGIGSGHGDKGISRRSVLGKSTTAKGDIGSDPLDGMTLDGGSTRSGIEIADTRQRHPDLGDLTCGDPPCLTNGLPSRAATQMCSEGLLECRAVINLGPTRAQSLQPTDDPRRAETALTRTGGKESLGPQGANLR